MRILLWWRMQNILSIGRTYCEHYILHLISNSIEIPLVVGGYDSLMSIWNMELLLKIWTVWLNNESMRLIPQTPINFFEFEIL